MRRILYLWIQHLHTQVERQWDAALNGRPVVVAAGRFQRGTVIDASPEAEAMGVGVGMTWRHAHRRCPTAHFVRYERPRYAPVIEQIGGVAEALENLCLCHVRCNAAGADHTIEVTERVRRKSEAALFARPRRIKKAG